MKRILIAIALFAVLLTGCMVVEDTGTHAILTTEAEEGEKITFEDEVRLTAEGFDADKITIEKGNSLTIFIVDDDINGHYLTMEDARLSEKQLSDGDKINVAFDETGKFEIIDETSKNSLIVNVK
ncbi:MAG: hypothetical protein KAK00_07505 [Nanoarchaeota archaeon]|nr:hypothetical protein [Nanoarchaeota archaeon]